jgi:hypothetical protein
MQEKFEEEIVPPVEEIQGDEETVEEETVAPERIIPRLWTQLMSLESLPTCALREISLFLPLYTMQFQDKTGQASCYVSHAQLCGLLGFKSLELFERCISSLNSD